MVYIENFRQILLSKDVTTRFQVETIRAIPKGKRGNATENTLQRLLKIMAQVEDRTYSNNKG